jgi:LuxR family transcriptional regulator, quorum-sensing system regulator SolR
MSRARIYLPENHILFTSQTDITEICAPLFKYLDIGYFHFRRTFEDGKYFTLSTDSRWPLYFLENNIPVKTPVSKEQYNSNSFFCLWSGNIPEKTVSDAKKYYSISNAIAMVETHKDYYDSYSFGLPVEKNNDLFINNLDILFKFKDYFLYKANDLIKKADKQIIIPDQHMKDLNLIKVMTSFQDSSKKENFIKEITPSKFIIEVQGKQAIITKMEHECIKYLSHGRRRKDIARLTGISPKTVDTHLEKARYKIGCYTNSELVDLWWRRQS